MIEKRIEIIKSFDGYAADEVYPVQIREDGKEFIRHGPWRMNQNDFTWRKRKGFIKVVQRETTAMPEK